MKIIAELCQNHNGDFNILKDMVKSASSAGATHIKIQHINQRFLIIGPGMKGLIINGQKLSIKRF